MKNIDEIGSANRLVYEDESYAVMGAALDVYYRLGSGFLEPVYQEAIAAGLGLREILFKAPVRLPIKYKDFVLCGKYRADFACFEKIIIEIKSQTYLTPIDWAQIPNYLKASRFGVGLHSISEAPSLSRKSAVSSNH